MALRAANFGHFWGVLDMGCLVPGGAGALRALALSTLRWHEWPEVTLEGRYFLWIRGTKNASSEGIFEVGLGFNRIFFFKLNVNFSGYAYCFSVFLWNGHVMVQSLRTPFIYIHMCEEDTFVCSDILEKKNTQQQHCYLNAFTLIHPFSGCDLKGLLMTSFHDVDPVSFLCF